MNRGFIRNLKVAGMWYINLNLALLSYVIVWLDRKIKFRLPFPRDTDELAKKEQWCVTALKKNNILPAEAEVQRYQVTPFTQELIFRSDIGLVEIDYKVNDKSKKLKCVAKFAPVSGTVWNRTIFNVQLNHIKEVLFNEYFVAADKFSAAPEVYYAKFELFTGNLCLLMEYMEDYKMYLDSVAEKVSSEHMQLALEGMASLHARYWNDNSEQMNKVFPIVPATVDFFDSMVAGKWSIAARKIVVKSWNLTNKPQTIIHGDARVGNMMFPSEGSNGKFVMIDWQAVRKGLAVYDLAYFIILSLGSEHRVQVEQQAKDRYYSFLVSNGVSNYTKDELEEDYRHACLCMLVLLSLPMLSGEASAEGEGAQIFAWGMGIWRERLQNKFSDFDYHWMSLHYSITEQEGRDAIAEMLGVIEERLKRIAA